MAERVSGCPHSRCGLTSACSGRAPRRSAYQVAAAPQSLLWGWRGRSARRGAPAAEAQRVRRQPGDVAPMNPSPRRLLAAVCVALAACRSTTFTQQPPPDISACARAAAQAGRSDRAPDWAATLIRLLDCPDHGPAAFGRVWHTPLRDSVQRNQLASLTGHLRDGALYRTVAAVAIDPALDEELRLAALEALIPWADSFTVALVRPDILAGRSAEGSRLPRVLLGEVDHPWTRPGREPLPLGVRDSIVGLLGHLAESEPSRNVRYVAARLAAGLQRRPR